MTGSGRVRVGVSACLMGKPVRFDGSHQRDRFLTEQLSRYVEWVPVCPEVGAGMGVPRPTLRLIGTPDAPRLKTSKGDQDWTDAVEAYSQAALDRLAGLELCGFVLKSRSPTCGMERVRVYGESGVPSKTGVGVFARALMERFPLLPVEEDGRLHDPGLREAFLDAVFAYARWRAFERDHAGAPRRKDLMAFHRQNKLLLRAHCPQLATEMGRLLARPGELPDRALEEQYGAMYMKAVKTRATRGRHVAAMRYVAGGLRRHASASERATLHEFIDDYAQGHAPRSVPVALLLHLAREHHLAYLSEQTYLEPYPKSLRAAA